MLAKLGSQLVRLDGRVGATGEEVGESVSFSRPNQQFVEIALLTSKPEKHLREDVSRGRHLAC